MRKAHIPPAVAIRGCNDKIVKDFIILNQVVSEKSLMKNVHMYYIRVTGKEKLKKESKMRISILIYHLHNTLCLPEGVHKI